MNALPFPSEKFIEDFVVSDTEKYGYCPLTELEPKKIYRQKNLGVYGIPDIVYLVLEPGGIRFEVVELKNETLREKHVAQLCRYMVGVQSMAQGYSKRMKSDIYVTGALAGPFDAQSCDLPFLVNLLPGSIRLFDIKLTMEEGFTAEEVGRGWLRGSGSAKPPLGVARDAFKVITNHQSGVLR